MSLPIPYSAASRRTTPPSISLLMSLALDNPKIISLAAGFVDLESLPVRPTLSTIEEILGDTTQGRHALQYGSTIGDLTLRERLIERLEGEDGVPSKSYERFIDRTIITTGSAQLIYLVCEALLDEGDIVLVEAPTYFVFLGPVETRGARAIRVPIDDDGLKLDALNATFEKLDREGLLSRVKLVYSIPEHSNPSGITLAASRRKPLVELVRRWSKDQRIFLLEDAAYRGLAFDGPEPPSLWSMDPDGETVIHARSFSKVFSPGLKTGYGIIPKGLVETVLNLKGNHDFGSSNLNQRILAKALGDGTCDAQLEKLVGVYRRKRDVFLGALEASMGDLRPEVSWSRPSGGLFVWMTIPPDVDTGFSGSFFQKCLEKGVIFVPGEFALAPEPAPIPRNQLRLSFGVPEEPRLIEGARRLSEALRECLGRVG